ncbi:hypothetical protein BDZ94DRAFT_1154878 [Collybia nuda]|uniref:Protein kinase domain-containing protein n=1 Tax=Collybia nuda TaxID=64659 RepID=A0A9P5YFU5_9AGAR|nr:hypothetical protein BDZ94DRAFT_1154878 [Collybia nuda]
MLTTLQKAIAIDAIRINDNRKVVIKLVRTWTEELPIAQYLTSPPMMSDTRNRSVALLDVIMLPDDDEHVFIVMPMLLRFDILPFRRVGEFAEAVHYFLQGLEFMHEHNIAHMDACLFNLMMDASKAIPKGFHFRNWWTHTGLDYKNFEFHERWEVSPVQYYYIDFGLSYQYPLGLKGMTESGSCGQDASVPEFGSDDPYDPFKVDIYQLGNVILNVVNKYEGLDLFLEIGRTMTSKIPEERPTASRALRQFERLLSSLKPPDLKRRIWRVDVPLWDRFRIKHLRSISRIPLMVE